MAVRRLSILAGRDRMSSVLSRFLSRELALERANNIAQALVFCPEDPERMALRMLRSTELANVENIAKEVADAWCWGVYEAERAC